MHASRMYDRGDMKNAIACVQSKVLLAVTRRSQVKAAFHTTPRLPCLGSCRLRRQADRG